MPDAKTQLAEKLVAALTVAATEHLPPAVAPEEEPLASIANAIATAVVDHLEQAQVVVPADVPVVNSAGASIGSTANSPATVRGTLEWPETP